MSRNDKQTEETIENFKLVAECFGQMYRRYLGQATPKVHMLEVHVPAELQKHKRLGVFGEDTIEREHHLCHVFGNLLKNVKTWKEQQRVKAARISQANDPRVLSAGGAMISGSKRTLSDASKSRSSGKIASKTLIKKEKESSFLDDVKGNLWMNDDDDDDLIVV